MTKILRISLLILFGFFALQPAFAQRSCATHEYNEGLIAKDPAYANRLQQLEAHTDNFARNHSNEAVLVTIPVVFHVVWNTAAQNIPDSKLLAQLDQLNLDFAKLNTDFGTVPSVFQPYGADTEVQFCLAQRNPSGQASTGIVRVQTSTTAFSTNNNVKFTATGGSNAWPRDKYLNIWVCNMSGGTLGYAQFPGGAANTDGIVLLYSSVGSMLSPGTAVPYHLGRTATHEVGHWLNLRHIWGDATCGNDFVDDTPVQNGPNYGCPAFPKNSPGCTQTSGSPWATNYQGDMFMSYMDYGDDPCLKMFSIGQKNRMQAIFATGGPRAPLMTSDGCVPVAGFNLGTPATTTSACPAGATMSSTVNTSAIGSFTGNISLSVTSTTPAGLNVTLSTASVAVGSPFIVTLNNANTLANGTYTATITGTATGQPNKTVTVTFQINAGTAPTISSQPSNQAVCIGQSGAFSVTATGTYQWQVSTNGGTTWTDISGSTASSLSITGAANLNNNQYRCIVTGQCGSTTSSVATLTVNATTAITTQPVNLALCSGSAASFTTAAAGGGLTYQWQLSSDGGTTWNAIGGATTSTYSIASVATTQSGNQFRCVVTGTCGSATTSAATLTVSSNITIAAQPSSQTVCEATNISFVSGAAGSGLAFQWQISTDGGTTWTNLSNGGVYAGATTTTLNITGVLPTQNGNRFRMVASNTSCAPGISNAATLTVNTFPSITTQPTSVTVCEGGTANFSVAATTGVGVLSYQWQFSTNGITYTSIPGATSSSYSITGAVVGQNNYVFRVIVTAGCGSVNSALVQLLVNPFPIISFSPPATICKSDQPIALSASPAGGTFSGAGVSAGSFNPTVAGVGARTVTYSVTQAGCTSNAARTILVNQCAERQLTIDKFPAIIVYPSPGNGQFNIGISTDLITKLEVRVFNSMGQQIKSQSFSGVRYGSVLPMDISGQPSGTYQVYMVNDENGKVTTKATSIVIYR